MVCFLQKEEKKILEKLEKLFKQRFQKMNRRRKEEKKKFRTDDKSFYMMINKEGINFFTIFPFPLPFPFFHPKVAFNFCVPDEAI